MEETLLVFEKRLYLLVAKRAANLCTPPKTLVAFVLYSKTLWLLQ
jgi:hypothetical protein